MSIIRWAAVAVTALFVLMNVGAALDPAQTTWVRVFGVVMAVAGTVAAFGLARPLDWGRPAVIAVGAVNVIGSVATLITGGQGAVIGLVVGGLAVLLGVLSSGSEHRTLAPR